MRKGPSLYQEEGDGHPYHQSRGLGLRRPHKQTLLLLQPLLVLAQTPLPCQFFTHLLFLRLKRYESFLLWSLLGLFILL